MINARVSYLDHDLGKDGARQKLLYVELGKARLALATAPCHNGGKNYLILSRDRYIDLISAIKAYHGQVGKEIDGREVAQVFIQAKRGQSETLDEAANKLFERLTSN